MTDVILIEPGLPTSALAPITAVLLDPEARLDEKMFRSPGSVANDSDYGLSSGIIANDFTRALDMALELETGMVHINDQT